MQERRLTLLSVTVAQPYRRCDVSCAGQKKSGNRQRNNEKPAGPMKQKGHVSHSNFKNRLMAQLGRKTCSQAGRRQQIPPSTIRGQNAKPRLRGIRKHVKEAPATQSTKTRTVKVPEYCPQVAKRGRDLHHLGLSGMLCSGGERGFCIIAACRPCLFEARAGPNFGLFFRVISDNSSAQVARGTRKTPGNRLCSKPCLGIRRPHRQSGYSLRTLPLRFARTGVSFVQSVQ